jgi:hypothetical protein
MSDSIKKIELDVQKVLDAEGKKFITNVRKNIQNKKLTKTGATQTSLHQDVTSSSLVVWGRKDFQNIETGTSPQEAKLLDFNTLRKRIYNWANYLGITWGSTKERFSFAWNVSNKIVEFGTQLYRKGGRKDIYSNEFQPLYDSLTKEIGKVILEYKLL